MTHIFIKFLFIGLCLMQISCGVDCSKVNCASPGGTLRFKVMKDGKNALYGMPHAIEQDSVSLYVTITDTSTYDIPIKFDSISETIELNMDQDVRYILKIDTFRTDTFEVFALPVGMDDCCKLYQLDSAKKNGQFFCGDGCNEVFEIQI